VARVVPLVPPGGLSVTARGGPSPDRAAIATAGTSPIDRRGCVEAGRQVFDRRRIAGEIDADRIEADEGVRELVPRDQPLGEPDEPAPLARVDSQVRRGVQRSARLDLDDRQHRRIVLALGRHHRHEIRLVVPDPKVAGHDRASARLEVRRREGLAAVGVGFVPGGPRRGVRTARANDRGDSTEEGRHALDRPIGGASVVAGGHGGSVFGDGRLESRSRAIRSSRSVAEEVS